MNKICHGKARRARTLLNSPASGWIANRDSASKLLRIMKLTTAILLATCMSVSAYTGAQQVTYSGKNVSLDVVFQAIGKQTGYVFLYNLEVLKGTKPVTISVSNVSVDEIMKKALVGQALEYSISDKTIFVKKAQNPAETFSNNSRSINIKGRVLTESGEAVPSASIKVKGEDVGTVSDAYGDFTINQIPENAVLIISAVNIETIEFKIKNQESVTIFTKTQVNPLEEVIYKGYYSEKRNLSVGNIGKITASEISKQPVSNPLLALQGRVAGVEITQTNGLAGGTVKVQIRGQNSLTNGTDPLYIIDGVPIGSQLPPGIGNVLGLSSVSYNNKQSFGSPLSYINPADIESIEVLKDADATAIYGSRAANGAILITLKKGKQGKPKFDLTAYTGWGSITRKIDMLNLRQYLDMRYEALRNDKVDIDPNIHYDLALWDTTRETNWQKELIGGTAKYHDIQSSISGGSELVQYIIGAGFHKETTVFPGDFSDQKGSVHFNISTGAPSNKFKAKISGSYLYDNNRLPAQDLTGSIYLSPNAPNLLNSDGSLNWEPYGTLKATWDNPISYTKRQYKNETSNLIANAVLTYTIINGLDLKSSFGYTTLAIDEISTTTSESINPNNISTLPNSTFGKSSAKSWIIEPQINYSRSFGKHKLEALIGSTFQSNRSTTTIINGSNFSSDQLLGNVQAAAVVTVNLDRQSLYHYNALYGRVNYNFNDKYLLNLTARRDGSSRFGPSNRFQNFGALGIGWIFTKEEWINKAIPFLTFGKLRASYGSTGSDQIGDYRYLDLYNSTQFNYQGARGLTVNNLYNPLLAWEETRKMEAGTELAFVNDRIVLGASYFNNKSGNQLSPYKLASTTGFPTIDANQDAVIKNWGYELTLNGTVIKSSRLSWNVNVNFSKTRNKITSVGKDYYGATQLVGHSINSAIYYKFVGIDSVLGEYRFADKLGKATANPDTSYVMDLSPSFYGGIQNSVSLYGFQLDFLFQFVKQKGQNNALGYYPGNFSGSANQPTLVLNRWTDENKRGAIQKFSQNGSLNYLYEFAQSSDYAYTDASYIRLKNIALSYTIPQRIKNKLKILNCRIFLQCQNLLTITNYKGSDPETRSLIALPPLKTITTGLQISF